MVLNCGNGHFEREFIEANIIDSAIGVDISEDLIIKANLIKGDKKIDYILSDINNFDFNTVNFDLLIVYAAGHHIKCLNKVFNGARKKLIENKGMILGLTIYERIEINMIMIFGKKLTFIIKNYQKIFRMKLYNRIYLIC